MSDADSAVRTDECAELAGVGFGAPGAVGAPGFAGAGVADAQVAVEGDEVGGAKVTSHQLPSHARIDLVHNLTTTDRCDSAALLRQL